VILYEVASSMGAEYHRLGVLLKLPDYFLEQVEQDHQGQTVRITFEILVRWFNTVNDQLDVVELATKLSEVKQKLKQKVDGDALTHSEYLSK